MEWNYKKVVIEVRSNGKFYFSIKEKEYVANSLELAKSKIDEILKDYYTFSKKDVDNLCKKLDKREADKENGYRWNPETKTLEMLVAPKFKVGNKIRLKGNPNYIYTITDIKENKSGCGVTFDLRFSEQDKNGNWFPKFDISTLVPFESRVLVRNAEEDIWKPAIFGCNADKTSRYYVLGGTCWSYCIPYEGNEHLLGKNKDCDEFYKTWK